MSRLRGSAADPREIDRELPDREFRFIEVVQDADVMEQLQLVPEYTPTIVANCKVTVGLKTKADYLAFITEYSRYSGCGGRTFGDPLGFVSWCQIHPPSSIPTAGASRYLRVSVTEQCNLRCVYCMPETGLVCHEGTRFSAQRRSCAWCGPWLRCGVSKVRFTGGEPLLRADLPTLVRETVRTKGVASVHLTTNGVLFASTRRRPAGGGSPWREPQSRLAARGALRGHRSPPRRWRACSRR